MTARREPAPRAARPPGLGDRWMAGEAIPGVAFALHDAVQIIDGAHAGRPGRVVLLAAAPPAAAYLVAVDGAGAAPVRVPQAALRPAS